MHNLFLLSIVVDGILGICLWPFIEVFYLKVVQLPVIVYNIIRFMNVFFYPHSVQHFEY